MQIQIVLKIETIQYLHLQSPFHEAIVSNIIGAYNCGRDKIIVFA